MSVLKPVARGLRGKIHTGMTQEAVRKHSRPTIKASRLRRPCIRTMIKATPVGHRSRDRLWHGQVGIHSMKTKSPDVCTVSFMICHTNGGFRFREIIVAVHLTTMTLPTVISSELLQLKMLELKLLPSCTSAQSSRWLCRPQNLEPRAPRCCIYSRRVNRRHWFSSEPHRRSCARLSLAQSHRPLVHDSRCII
jgi:hypothetical protein